MINKSNCSVSSILHLIFNLCSLLGVPDGECLTLNLSDYRSVPVKDRMVMFFGTTVTEYKKDKAFGNSLGITFKTADAASQFNKAMKMAATLLTKAPISTISNGQSEFNSRTEENSANQYFQFYSWLSQQQNMMQDFVRTSTYQKSMLGNPSDFVDKVSSSLLFPVHNRITGSSRCRSRQWCFVVFCGTSWCEKGVCS